MVGFPTWVATVLLFDVVMSNVQVPRAGLMAACGRTDHLLAVD
jgi:hypothetical protein